MYSLILLLQVIANINYLQDVVIGAQLQGSNIDLNVVLQEVLSQLTNFFRPSGAPHQSLTVWLVKTNEKVSFIYKSLNVIVAV